MKSDKELNNILDECLERLLSNENETVDGCLQSYPEHASELEPLLKTAFIVRRASSAVKPREEFRARARYQFGAALHESWAKGKRPFFAWLPGWAAVLSIVLIFLLAGGGTIAVAGNTMPDSPLYPVKLATEQVRMMLPASDLRRAEIDAEFVDRRVDEIVYMASKGDVTQVDALIERLDERLVMLADLAGATGTAGEIPQEDSAEVRSPSVLLAPEPETAKGAPPEAIHPYEPIPFPAPAVAPPPALGAASENNSASVVPDGQAVLKQKIAAFAVKHPAALQEALEKAPASVRADVARAISITVAGYAKALQSLDEAN
ncbi:MAG: DUF5667 domain-containing protein [Chloroflexota bacterium]